MDLKKWQNNLQKINEDLPKIKQIYSDILNWMMVNKYQGGCHLISAVMYIILDEINIKSRLCIGEVKAESGHCFSHSWIEIDDKIYDISIAMPQEGGIAFPSVYRSIDLETNKPTSLQYGFNSQNNLDEIATYVLEINLGEYSDATNGKLFEMTSELSKIVNIQLDIQKVIDKHSSTHRILVG